MAERQTRETLRKFFAAGQMPTQEHFSDLIASMLNTRDEGFNKTPDNGLEVVAAPGKPALLSFYRSNDPAQPAWALRHGAAGGALQFVPAGAGAPQGDSVLSLVPAQTAAPTSPPTTAGQQPPMAARVGVNTADPRHTLDVAGVLASQGRIGSYRHHVNTQLPADGQPQTLIDRLSGCQAFEIMAGVGAEGTGRYALLHAIAINTYNPVVQWWQRLWPGARQRGIRSTQAHYGRRCDSLLLWWEGGSGRGAEYRLCLRTGCDYGPQVAVRATVTQLWLDPQMAGSAVQRD
jgi:hypothetical protein